MANTTTNVRFYKKGYESATAAAKQSTDVAGSIVFDTKSKSIYVAGTAFGGNITDVTLDSGVLTITKAVGRPISLDFTDTASATATLHVFENINKIIGKDMYVQGGEATGKLNYSGSNYLNGYGEGESAVAAVTTLVDADMRLDALIKAINDKIAAMDNKGETMSSVSDGVVTLYKTITETDGVIDIDTADTNKITLAKVATTGESTDVAKSNDSTATYDTTSGEISGDWIEVVNKNQLKDGDTVDADLTKLDTKIAGLADELIADEKAINNTFDNVKTSVGLDGNMAIAFEGTYTKGKTVVKDAIDALDTAITNLDVDTVATAVTTTGETGTVVTIKGVKEENGKIAQGEGTTSFTVGDGALKISGYGATSEDKTSIATVSATDIHSANDTADSEIKLGTSFIIDTTNKTINLRVNQAVAADNNIATMKDITSLSGAMHYKGALAADTDWPETVVAGDTYVVTTGFTHGTTVLEKGDMVVFGTSATATDYNVVQTNMTMGVADGQVAMNDGALTENQIIIASTKGVKTSGFTTDAETTEGTTTISLTSTNTTLPTSKNVYDAITTIPIQSVDGSTIEKAKSVTSDNNINVKVTATTDIYKNVTLDTAASLNMATVADDGKISSGNYAVSAINAKKITDAAIDALAGDKTSDDAAVATVEVKTENGEVSDVIVTNVSAGVVYTAAKTEPATEANLTATTETGAVTGADIATIKSYIDAQDAAAKTTVSAAENSAITVTETAKTDGHTDYAVNLVWDEWAE